VPVCRWPRIGSPVAVNASLFLGRDFQVAHDTIVPSMPHTRDEWSMLVAILGTTISPYLFFGRRVKKLKRKRPQVRVRWQSEEERRSKNFS
jgi:Mn2+/Fe2+ NRAMP family transporter